MDENLKKLIDRQEAIVAKAVSENRGMNDDEKKDFDGIQVEIDALS